jgi:Cu-Zn family superoxide dismutase
VVTDRFTLPEVIGRTLVIHSGADDFRSQPAGNAGTKIACGVIRCG